MVAKAPTDPRDDLRRSAEEPGASLAVDLDGTLVRTDTLVESWVSACRHAPLTALLAPLYLLKGRACLKERLASAGAVNPALLPYNEPLLAFLRIEKAGGRRLVLATASDRRIAQRVADHLDLFDQVLASADGINLKGEKKARALIAELGQGRFTYAGNDRHDLAVWEHAASAVLVNVPDRVAEAIHVPVEKRLETDDAGWHEAFRAMRVYQWVKNILVFLPLVAAGAIGDAAGWLGAFGAFLAFSLVASGVYLINDLADLEADRKHPQKQHRPSASGSLPLIASLLLAPLLIVAGLAIATAADREAALVLLAYVFLTTLYSAYAKKLPLVDVFLLAVLYSLRVIAGGFASGHPASVWLLSFSSFFFLSLAFAKRCAEISRHSPEHPSVRRGYETSDIQILTNMGIASAFAAAIVLSLYVESAVAGTVYARPSAVWLLVPLGLFWQCRIWLAATRGKLDSDPILFAARDRGSWWVLAAGLLVYLVAI